MMQVIAYASILALAFGHPAMVEKRGEPSCQPPSGTSLTWSNQCEMYPERWLGLSKEKTDAVTAEKNCVAAGGRLVSNWDYQLNTCVYDILAADQGNASSIEAVIGLQWKPELGYYVWIDGMHDLSSPDAYNTCANSVCTVEYDDNGMPLESMVASLSNGYYVWQPSGIEAVNQYICELNCEEVVTTTTTTRDFNFTTQPTVTTNRIAYLSDGHPTRMYVQTVNGDEFSLDNDITLPSSDNMPYLPYMIFNKAHSAFELVGDWYYSDNFDYHYFVAEDGSATPVDNSNYDGRERSTFVYTDELGSLMIAGHKESQSYSYFSSTLQITPNTVVNTNLPNIPNPMAQVSAAYTASTVLCIGGYNGEYQKSVYQLDLQDMSNLSWKTLSPLKHGVNAPTTAVAGTTFFTAGDTYPSELGVERYNLQTQESTYAANQFDSSMYMACSIISDGVLTFFGGSLTNTGVAYQAVDDSNGFSKVTISSLNGTTEQYGSAMQCAAFYG